LEEELAAESILADLFAGLFRFQAWSLWRTLCEKAGAKQLGNKVENLPD
jgi:hypothetical protein